jgi:hypothetical protein
MPQVPCGVYAKVEGLLRVEMPQRLKPWAGGGLRTAAKPACAGWMRHVKRAGELPGPRFGLPLRLAVWASQSMRERAWRSRPQRWWQELAMGWHWGRGW